MRQVSPPWYGQYKELRQRAADVRQQFRDRCRVLGAEPGLVIEHVRLELIARSVHESNWQEGEYLDEPRTQELVDEALEGLPQFEGPHLALDQAIEWHRSRVLAKKKRGIKREELAAFNLSFAHHMLRLIYLELVRRRSVGYYKALRDICAVVDKAKADKDKPFAVAPDFAAHVEKIRGMIGGFLDNPDPVFAPMEPVVRTEGELKARLADLSLDELVHPLRVSHIHALHRITLMGILNFRKLGKFRQVAVHVGAPAAAFPSPGLVPGLMTEFCKWCHPIGSGDKSIDWIELAAEVSHRFVSIHPYADGNGRVSRLLMNLVLQEDAHPPIHLKADKKGRHRYVQALRRADRGNIEPMACLIASALVGLYSRLLETAASPWHLEQATQRRENGRDSKGT